MSRSFPLLTQRTAAPSTMTSKKPPRLPHASLICSFVLPVLTPPASLRLVFPRSFSPYGYCWVVEDSRTPSWGLEFWGWFSFYAWVWASVGLIFVLYIIIAKRLMSDQIPQSTRVALISVIKKLWIFPIIIIVCWLLTCTTDVVVSLQSIDTVNFLSFLLPGLQGAFTGITFYVANDDVRSHWQVFVSSRFKNRQGPEKKNRTTKGSGGGKHLGDSGNERSLERSARNESQSAVSTASQELVSSSPSLPTASNSEQKRRSSGFWDGASVESPKATSRVQPA